MTDVTIPRALLGLADINPLAPTCLSDPIRLDLCVYRGDSGRLRVSVTASDGTTPIDVSGATWDADIRATADDTVLAASFDVEPVPGETNKVDMVLTADQSALLTAPVYVYDLEMTLGTEVTTLLVGGITVTKDVSRPT